MNLSHGLYAAMVAFAGLTGLTGCATTSTPSYIPWGAPPPRAADVGPPPPAPGDAFNKDARADHFVGGIAAQIGSVQKLEDEARADRDVVKLNCVHTWLDNLRGLEGQAHEQRSAMRAADDEDAANGPFNVLASLDTQARGYRASAAQCQGQQAEAYRGPSGGDRDGDGIPDSVDKAEPEPYSVRLHGLEGRVDDLKDTIRKSKSRLALLGDTVLAGAAPPLASPGPGSGGSGGRPMPTSQAQAPADQRQAMLIRTAEISLAVYEVDKNLNAVEKTANELGGYLALRSDRQITVRVPAEKFDELVAKIERMGDVLHKNIAAEDVSDQYVDVEMRLKNAISVRDRLEKLLVGATVKDAVDIHRELGKVTEEIERLEGKLKLLKDRIAYSSVSVSFEPTQAQAVRSQALLPFSWMTTMGLQPLLTVPRESK